MRKGKRIRDKLYWTPFEMEPPKEYGFYNVTLKFVSKSDYEMVFDSTFYKTSVASYSPASGFWKILDNSVMIYTSVYQYPEVVAWAPLPGAYIPPKGMGKFKI